MNDTTLNILLADDDLADCMLFREALAQINLRTNLAIVNDGEELMHWLAGKKDPLTDVLFLDLNMPRKSGQECLAEMKQDKRLKKIPVIICSTSYLERMANELYDQGACYYIQKPVSFDVFVRLIESALHFIEENIPAIRSGTLQQPPKDHFLLHEPSYH
jgi:CheY-like chemotaxis protein